MLTKAKKIELVEELSKIIQNNPNILFVDFTGLKMDEISSLKKDLKKEGVGFKALKKSLLEFAFKKSGKDSFDMSSHKSSVAIVYGSAEPNVMAKILHSFSVKSKKLAILGGFLIGEKMMKDKVVMLAQIPSREVLLAQFLQLLMSPVSGFVRALDGVAKKGN
jgi:large subunit ribosomal protein L10